MQSLPLFLSSILSKEKFIQQFSSVDKIQAEWIPSLIATFGYNYGGAISPLLGEDVRKLYEHELARLDILQQICFKCFRQNIPVTSKHVADVYAHVSLLDGILLQERIDRDTKAFLCADRTPQQTAKFLGLYRITWVKELVDDIQKRSIIATGTLKDNMFYPDDDQEKLLYNHAGLIWFGKSISYAEMYYGWSRDKKDVYFKGSSLYCKLFLEGKTIEPLIPPEGPFLSHRINATLFTFFSHHETCLPEKKFMTTLSLELSQLFSNSEQAHQDAYCYINKLHQLFNGKTKAFDFDQALLALQFLELDQTGKLYHFLRTLLHYFHCLSVLSDHQAFRSLLFHALYPLSSQYRQELDLPIKDEPPLQTFQVDKMTCQFILHHSPHLWGPIFLNFINLNGKYPYFEVNLNDHIELLRIMEEGILSRQLPMKLVISFLQHQPAKKGLAEVLKKMIDLKQEIEREQTSFDTVDWKSFRNMFLKGLNGPDKDPIFMKDMEQLAFTLQYAAHPVFKSSSTYTEYLFSLPFEMGLFLLDALILDQSSPDYNLLHARLHAIHASKRLQNGNGHGKAMIFQDILAIPLERRKAFDQPIVEKGVLREPVLFEDLMALFNKRQDISPEERGETYLQIVHTQSKGRGTYLPIPQLLKLIVEIEKVLMMPLPVKIVNDLIFFRLTKEGIFPFPILEKITTQTAITRLKEELMQQFEDPSLIFEFESPRQIAFKENVLLLTELIGQACYPASALNFLNIKTNDTFFKPLHPKNPLGPLKMTFWIPLSFVVILKKGDLSCFFLIPLRMPKEKKAKDLHLEAIEEAIKELGNGESSGTIFDPFAKTLAENFSTGYHYLFNPREVPFTTLSQNKTGIAVKSKYLEGTVNKKDHIETLKNLKKSPKGLFPLIFTMDKRAPIVQEFRIEWEQGPKGIKITLSAALHHTLTFKIPLFHTEEEWSDTILYHVTLFFCQCNELEPARLLQEIEEILMTKLPKELVEKIFSFRLENNLEKMIAILKEFKTIQDGVKGDFSSLDKPFIFATLQKLKQAFIQEYNQPSNHILTDLLERACCPALASFCTYQEDISFQPIYPNLPLGPLKLTCRFQNPESKQESFYLILKNEKVSCFFPFMPGAFEKSDDESNNLTRGFFYLFEPREVPFTTISQTKEGFSCHSNGLEFKIKKEEHKNLKTLKKSTKSKFSFYLWPQEKTRIAKDIYLTWQEKQDHCQITLSLSQYDQGPSNFLTLTHPLFNNEEDWVEGVLYQAALLYFLRIYFRSDSFSEKK
jgi:hypothetical protein